MGGRICSPGFDGGIFMSDTNSLTKIKFAGKEYEVQLNINVIDAVQDEFNMDFFDIEKMFDDNRKLYKVAKFLLWQMVNDSIRRKNIENGTNEKLLTLWEVGDNLTFANITETVTSVREAIINSLPQSEGDEEEEEPPR